jgi:uncharacterized UBP type Zn finger protein
MGSTKTAENTLHWDNLTAEQFLKEYLGASEVMLNMDEEGEISLCFTYFQSSCGEQNLEVATLKPGQGTENIRQLADAINSAFPTALR